MLLNDISRDARFALRQVRRRPGFCLIVILTLGVCTGVNTAMFSLVHAALLRPFPFPEPERLLRIQTQPIRSSVIEDVSLPDLEDYRLANQSLREIGAYQERSLDVIGSGSAYSVQAAVTTPGVFRALAVSPWIGRTFLDSEDKPGGPVFKVILSHTFWSSRLGSDPDVVGRTIRLAIGSFEVIGVMPQGFEFPNRTELWIPMQAYLAISNADWIKGRGIRDYRTIARLRRGATSEQARSDLEGLAKRLEKQYPETNPEAHIVTLSLRDAEAGDLRPYLILLMSATALVLLIGCANAANLMLASSATRSHESTIRAALGAGTWRLARQFLTESLILGIAGSALGLILATLGVTLAPKVLGDRLPSWIHIDLSWPVLLFNGALAVGTSLLFGLAPALGALRVELNEALKSHSRSTAQAGSFRRALIAGEMALSLVLLIGAGLLIRTFDQLRRVHPGFQPEGVVTFRLSPYRPGVRDIAVPQYKEFYTRVIARLNQLPSVVSAGVSNSFPFATATSTRSEITVGVRGDSATEKHQRGAAALADVSPDYFAAMGIPLLEGRTFNDGDTRGRPWVMILSERTARLLFGDRPALGQQVRAEYLGAADPWATVVGIVGNIKHRANENDLGMEMYYPFSQYPVATARVAVRFRGDPRSPESAIRAAVREISPDTAVSDLKLMTDQINETLWQQKLWGTMLAGFAVLALALAVIGLYGVLSYLVRQSTREIGIRIAVGASPARVIGHIAREGFGMVGIGLVLGGLIAAATARFLRSLLFSVSAYDPFVYVAVPLILIGVTMLACVAPALRAARLDPITALKQE